MQKKISNENIAYKSIKKAIMLKKLLPGQRLSEEWLSSDLKMSRTPVRAALKQLENEKIIKLIPHQGAYIHEPSVKEIKDVFNLRILLECYAAKIAASIITEKTINYLKSLIEKEINAYKTKDFESFLYAVHNFHKTPAIITENDFLVQQITLLMDWSDCYLILKDPFYKQTADTAPNIEEHSKIVASLEKNDPIKTENVVRSHLESTLETLEKPQSIFT